MSDLMWIGLFLGFFVVGPPLCWLLGLMNPLGFMGVPPWRVPKSAWAADRENRVWTEHYHREWLARQQKAP